MTNYTRMRQAINQLILRIPCEKNYCLIIGFNCTLKGKTRNLKLYSPGILTKTVKLCTGIRPKLHLTHYIISSAGQQWILRKQYEKRGNIGILPQDAFLTSRYVQFRLPELEVSLFLVALNECFFHEFIQLLFEPI